MTRSILAGLLGLFSIAAVGALPLACQSGGIGDPCIPEDEYSAAFAGFKVSEENIESRSFQCSTRICLVNHFQGRVTCPFGQPPPTPCEPSDVKNPGHDKGDCAGAGEMCVVAGIDAPDCVPPAACTTSKDCPNGGECNAGHCPETCTGGLTCDKTRKVCGCQPINATTKGTKCILSNQADANSVSVLTTFICHKPGDCQTAASDPTKDTKKACCVPGTDTPTSTSVCGQCVGDSTKKSHRSADQSVYCSCRCGVADGAADPESNFNFCDCPTGFTCDQVRPDVGIGDHLLTGKYCIKDDTKYVSDPVTECGKVTGFVDPATCEGL
jgi:hypothetical protein